jgi:hypothetical protein
LIHIDARVREHIMSIPAIRNRQAIYQLAEAPSLYGKSKSSGLLPQIIDSLENLTLIEQERQALLTREGLQGFLTRLGITELHA